MTYKDTITSIEDLEEETTIEEETDTDVDEIDTEEEEETVEEEETEVEETDEEEEEETEEGSEEEIQALLAAGQRLKEYKAAHPGFDPFMMHKDYTQKSMELAKLKQMQQQPVQKPVARQEENIDLTGVNPDDVALIEKVLKSKGYVHRSDLEKIQKDEQASSYETAKQTAINAFLADHTQYKPENDPDNVNWGALLEEFGIYKIPSDPRKFTALLKKAHNAISKPKKTFDAKKASEYIAKKRVNKLGQATGSGKGGAASKKTKSSTPALARQHLKGYSEEELDEMFN